MGINPAKPLMGINLEDAWFDGLFIFRFVVLSCSKSEILISWDCCLLLISRFRVPNDARKYFLYLGLAGELPG